MAGDIAKRWKELCGINKWKNLLDPLDLDLRRCILHYGDMAELAYIAFNSDRRSKYVGDSNFTKEEFFTKTGYMKANPFRYEVTKYIYATSSISLPECFIVKSLSREAWNKESNWFGYIAVATNEGKKLLGRRDIVVAWRGTIQVYEWANDFDFPLESAISVFPPNEPDDPSPQIANGWLSLYTSASSRSQFDQTSAREQVQGELKRLLELYKDEEVSITFTGHSLGAVLSIIAATDFFYNEWETTRLCCVTAFAFASPRVGDKNFKSLVDGSKHLNILTITNVPDIIPRYPVFEFTNVGEKLEINTLKSSYMKRTLNLSHFHNLEAYLHGVAGTQHSNGEFRLEIKRDIALINKEQDALEDKYLVPGYWWIHENKGMVQMDDGTWELNGDRLKNQDDNDEGDQREIGMNKGTVHGNETAIG